MTYKYTGRIFKIPFPFTDLAASKARPALALSEPDSYGDISFAFITNKKTRSSEWVLDVPEGLLPFESVVHLDKLFLLNSEIILKELAQAPSNFLEHVFKQLTLSDTQRYFKYVHKPGLEKPFAAGKSPINYAGRVFDE